MKTRLQVLIRTGAVASALVLSSVLLCAQTAFARRPGASTRSGAGVGGSGISELAASAATSASAMVTAAPPVATNKPARVLLVTGVDYPGHPWKQTAPVLVQMLQRDLRLAVSVIEDPNFLDSPSIQAYDAVLLHFMNWEVPSPGNAARENLRQMISKGKGLMLVHFACGAWQDWPEFKDLAGRVWDPKLRGHDPRGVFNVSISDPQHPITQGLQPFETDDELYTCLTGDRPIHIIATARSKVDSKDYPMAFVFEYGKGRVFHSVLGHDAKALSASGVGELFRRGCAWAAGLPPVAGGPQ